MGSGNSTLHFLQNRATLQLSGIDSFDDNEGYLQQLRSSFPSWEHMTFHCVDLRGPIRTDRDPELNYASFPLGLNRKFDVIFIDGRRRMECALTGGAAMSTR